MQKRPDDSIQSGLVCNAILLVHTHDLRRRLGFLTLLVRFGSPIAFLSRELGGNIAASLHGLLEGILIAGIPGGVVALFQPFAVGCII